MRRKNSEIKSGVLSWTTAIDKYSAWVYNKIKFNKTTLCENQKGYILNETDKENIPVFYVYCFCNGTCFGMWKRS